MSENRSCVAFQELLSRLDAKDAPSGVLRRLREHAADCDDCAALLRLREALAHPRLADLEDAVPEHVVEAMTERVIREIDAGRASIVAAGAKPASESGRGAVSRRERWLVPLLAAAVLLLILGGSFLYLEMKRLQERELILSRDLERQDELLADLSREALNAVVRSASERESRDYETLRLADLRSFLEGIPENTPLLGLREIEVLLGIMPSHEAKIWRHRLATVNSADGLEAGELRQLLDGARLDPELRLPASRLNRLERRLGRAVDL